MLSAFGALFFGAVISFIGVVLHNSIQPFGLLLALLTTYIGFTFATQLFGSHKFKVITVIGWLLITLRAGTYGLSQEILIISNLYGNLFLLGGVSIAAFTVLKKN